MSAPTAKRQRTIQPSVSPARLGAGAFGGGVGGLVFALLMAVQMIANPANLSEQTGMSGLISRLLGTQEGLWVWTVHLLYAILLGAIFALLVRPTSLRAVLPLGLAWGVLHWLFGAFLVLRSLVGAPLTLDAGAWSALAGHLLYGLVLGFVYMAFYREEEAALHHEGGFRAVPPRTG